MSRASSRRRTSRRVAPNTLKPRGFPWNERVEVFHTTVAMDAVRSEGLKSRRQLAVDAHATGGGPDESISFTTDSRVTLSIAVGLRVFAHIARGKMQLGQLIIDMHQLAPKGTAKQIDSMRLTPEEVVHIDSGLVPFSAGHGAWRNLVAMEVLGDSKRDLVDVNELFAGGTKPYAVSGWATPEVVERMQRQSAELRPAYSVASDLRLYAANRAFELYKYALSYAEYEREAYNPLFMHTAPTFMSTVADDQIGVVSAMLDAKWLCAEAGYAEKLGYDISGMGRPTISDWSHGCEHRLRRGGEVYSKPVREWELPEASDTVSYAGAMAEVRVYDASMIRQLRVAYDLDDVLAETSTEWWKKKGIEVEKPVVYPHFDVRHTQMV